MPIFIDNRGSGEEEIYHLLKDKHLAVKRIHIDSGDIVFGDVGIERKTISDLIRSVVGSKKHPASRHFWDQLEVLKNTYKTPLVIIEGSIDYKDKLVSGILFSLTFGWKLQWINTYNTYDTVEAICRMFTRYGTNKSKGYPPAAVRKELTPPKIRWAMLQCVKGIGPVTSKSILSEIEFMELGNTNPEYLAKQVKGLGVKTAKKIVEVFKVVN